MTRMRLIAVAGGLAAGLFAGVSCQPAAESPAAEPPVAEAEPRPPVPEADLQAVAAGNNEFAFDLYKKLAETETGNIVVSPYSVRTALAMTYAGRRARRRRKCGRCCTSICRTNSCTRRLRVRRGR